MSTHVARAGMGRGAPELPERLGDGEAAVRRGAVGEEAFGGGEGGHRACELPCLGGGGVGRESAREEGGGRGSQGRFIAWPRAVEGSERSPR